MLATPLVREIDRLLQEGHLSQRKIAAQLGVSRGIVGAIANGRRGLHGVDELDADIDRSMSTKSMAIRCPHCGYRVFAPCLVCRARDRRNRQRQNATVGRLRGPEAGNRPGTSGRARLPDGSPRPYVQPGALYDAGRLAGNDRSPIV